MDWRLYTGSDLRPLARVWHAAAAQGAASIFQCWTFARHWAATFSDTTEFHIQWRASPPAVIPWIRRAGRVSLLGEGMFDYLDAVGVPSGAPARPRGPLRVCGVPETSRWACEGERSAWAAAPIRAADASPAKLELDHRRVVRRWEAARVALHPEVEPAARIRLLDWILERKVEQCAAMGRPQVLGAYEQRWMRRMVDQEPELCELWSLRQGTQRFAGMLCWLAPAMRYAYTIAYDPEAAALSPGILVLFAVLRHTMSEGRGFNFLIGEQAFKQRFATGREPLLVVHGA